NSYLKELKFTSLSNFIQVTCPGVVLKDKEDIYLSICVFGQYKKTQCVPANFPLVFNARMVFEKVFPEAVDPGDVVAQLECKFLTFNSWF
uniref:Spermatogenesis-associated protein 6 N-terminal domain-containing protein n=1 Tax=Ursus americanus TaxID=9643 RepID=A0A452RYU9_URSAM